MQLAGRPGLRAEGVDVDASAIARARAAATAAGVGDQIVLHTADAKEFTSPHRFDLVLSVGAAHAFGGLLPTLDAAAGHLAAHGGVLVGVLVRDTVTVGSRQHGASGQCGGSHSGRRPSCRLAARLSRDARIPHPVPTPGE